MMPRDTYKGDSFIFNPDLGVYEFGWQEEKYFDFGSKANWAWIQSQGSPEQRKMLDEVLMEYTGATSVTNEFTTDWRDEDKVGAYIDHASRNSKSECFENKEKLINFLFNKDSYIDNDNDNH